MRPTSQKKETSASKKPEFQMSFKSRSGTSNLKEELNRSFDTRRVSLSQRKTDNAALIQEKSDRFYQTASKLYKSNFDHIEHMQMINDNCECGRHLYKFNMVKPDLTKTTLYRKSFTQQMHIPNIVNHDKEYSKLLGPHLEMSSTYREGFKDRKGDDIERPIPEDLLHSNGPCPQLSSYSSQFPGYRGDNQYVKPTDKHTRGYFPLRSKSTYTKQFIKKDPKKDDYTYYPDQLRTGSNWYGKSSYENHFANPNPQYMAKKVKIIEKLEQNPDFSRQYETIYKNDFINKQTTVCPAKLLLEKTHKGQFFETRGNFTENTDFKALNPSFHAISTSKHSFV